ncbi:hypothetical protein M2401_005002 [Pseudomonas sp. JUb42]|uniref:hypothetical protein n=1 Tax=Pseudomonas sp. JUb42 TaxID=2940611 RepID=UPI002169A64C|nr:hypothetical protein [Pseudomonas sp. JUb42]MCS3471240.1 hypothetical protein [Pseudomonas sp. JUb42]
MIPKLVNDLWAIASKPGVTPGTLLIVTRRTCRIWVAMQDQIYSERREYMRCAKTLRKRLPYSRLDVELLEMCADNHRSAELEMSRKNLARFGYCMEGDGTKVAGALGFDRLCDILNVNPVHRAKLRRAKHKTLRGLVFEARIEDSADVKNQQRSGGPLCEAFYSAYCDGILQGSLKDMGQQPVIPVEKSFDMTNVLPFPTIH